jgi:hypothetical protein
MLKEYSRLLLIFILLCALKSLGANVAIFSFKITVKAFSVPPSLKGFTSLYKTELSRQPGITVIEREKLSDITSEIALGQAGLLSKDQSALDSINFEGVDFIIGGEITQTSSNTYRVDLSIREVKTAKIIGEKLSGNIEKYNEAGARMLAHNTAYLLAGKGKPIQKKVIQRRTGIIIAGLGIAGIATGAVLKVVGNNRYQDYEALDENARINEFNDTFNRAQTLTNAGEATLYISSGFAVIGVFSPLGNRKNRTLTRE